MTTQILVSTVFWLIPNLLAANIRSFWLINTTEVKKAQELKVISGEPLAVCMRKPFSARQSEGGVTEYHSRCSRHRACFAVALNQPRGDPPSVVWHLLGSSFCCWKHPQR